MARLWAKTATFESISVGDGLPILVKWETKETIARSSRLFLSTSQQEPRDPAMAEEEPAPEYPGPAALAVPGLVAYVAELLEKAFPIPTTPEAKVISLDLAPCRKRTPMVG